MGWPPPPGLLVITVTLLGWCTVEVVGVGCGVPEGDHERVTTGLGVTLYTCNKPDIETWTTGDRVLTSMCQETMMASCVEHEMQAPCEGPPPPPPAYSVVVEDLGYSTFYGCEAGKKWLSGYPGQLSQCINGQWTSIIDQCEEECEIPRDCSEATQYGFTTSGLYSVLASGDRNDSSVQVYCLLANSTGDSGWTLVLNVTANPLAPTPLYNYQLSIKDPQQPNYFIGWNNLLALHQTNRTQVYMFLLTMATGEKRWAVYDDVMVSANLTLVSTGLYHGDAGDILTTSVSSSVGPNSLWWQCVVEPCATFDMSKITWTPLIGETVKKVQLYVRPRNYDIGVSCRTEIGLDPLEMSTFTYNMTMSRGVGTTFSYMCQGDLREGVVGGGSRTVSGTSQCLDTLVWDFLPQLPCTAYVECTVGYFKTSAGTCLKFSSQDLSFGMVTASLVCSQEGDSLARIYNETDLSTAVLGNFYYTAHIFNGTTVSPAPPPIACAAGETCIVDATLPCLAMGLDAQGLAVARAQDCLRDDTYALCMNPGYCPETYTLKLRGFT
ncbi:uncharacterized protein LOC121861364 [Homarus americanus]|uniref:uncharacterized protein LOC121861364 n=1 Tax=Homarus americanus TaxID=6706 RepID=UPI001C43792F|nr:uncharacterized protein LOC121861364 [Homarus americanus]